MSQISLTEYLASIANAIRTKTGKTEKINAQNFATEILNMVVGGDGSGDNNSNGGNNIVTTPAYFYGYTSSQIKDDGDKQMTIYGKGSLLVYLCSESPSKKIIVSELGENLNESESCFIVDTLPKTDKSILDDGVMNYYILINDSNDDSPEIYLNLQNVQSGKPTWITLSQLIQMMSEDNNAQQIEYNLGYVDDKDDQQFIEQLIQGKYFFVRKDYSIDLYFRLCEQVGNSDQYINTSYYTRDFFKNVFNLQYDEIELFVVNSLPKKQSELLNYSSEKLSLYVNKEDDNVYLLIQQQNEQNNLVSLQEWIYNRVSSTMVRYCGVIHSEDDANNYEPKHIDFYTIIKNKKVLRIEDEYDEYKVIKKYGDDKLVELIDVTSAIDYVKLQQDKVVTSSGTYTPDEGYDGIASIVVQVSNAVIEIATYEEMVKVLSNATSLDVGNVYKYLGEDTEEFKCGALYEIYEEAETLTIRATNYSIEANDDSGGESLLINSEDYDIEVQ